MPLLPAAVVGSELVLRGKVHRVLYATRCFSEQCHSLVTFAA